MDTESSETYFGQQVASETYFGHTESTHFGMAVVGKGSWGTWKRYTTAAPKVHRASFLGEARWSLALRETKGRKMMTWDLDYPAHYQGSPNRSPITVNGPSSLVLAQQRCHPSFVLKGRFLEV